MRKHILLMLMILTNFSYAQDNSSDYHNTNHSTDTYHLNQNSTSSQDDKSTPAEDVPVRRKKDDKPSEGKKGEEKYLSPHTFTSQVIFVSDYRDRGISQTLCQPAVQGGFDYSHTSGFYLGTWASNVDGTTHLYNNTSLEWDFYGGYKGELFPCSIPHLTYNVGLLYYYFPGGKTKSPNSVNFNTAELYIEINYKWLTIKYWQALTDFFGVCSDSPSFNWKTHREDKPNGSSRGSTYIEAHAIFDLYQHLSLPYLCLKGGKLSLALNIGHQTVRNYEHYSYTDWRAALNQEFEWFNLFVSYVGSNAKRAYFTVPDNSYHRNKIYLGGQSVIVGVIRGF